MAGTAELLKWLEQSRIELEPKSLQVLAKGYNSTVYKAQRQGKDITIHLINLTQEHKKQKVWEKFEPISHTLLDQGIPTPKYLTGGKVSEDQHVVMHNYIEGEVFGQRKVEQGKIIDTHSTEHAQDYYPKIAAIMNKMHHIKLSGFGNIQVKEGKMQGEFTNWKDYLMTKTTHWIDVLEQYKIKDKKEIAKIRNTVRKALEKYDYLLDCTQGVFLHWDLATPGNILVHKGEISAIIDFEWSAIGDPAWDFVYIHKDILKHYLTLNPEINQEEFKMKIKLYTALWFLWGTTSHLERPKILQTLYDIYETNIQELL